MAKCTPGVPFEIPELPPGLSFSPPAPPAISVGAEICCKQALLTTPPLPITLGPAVVNPAFLAAVNAAVQAANQYINSIGLKCPKE